MKKLTALLLGAAMALSLAACGATATVEESAAEETSSSEAVSEAAPEEAASTEETAETTGEAVAVTTVTEGVRLYDPLTGRHWMLGDAIKIKVTAADVPLGRIDFDFIPM